MKAFIYDNRYFLIGFIVHFATSVVLFMLDSWFSVGLLGFLTLIILMPFYIAMVDIIDFSFIFAWYYGLIGLFLFIVSLDGLTFPDLKEAAREAAKITNTNIECNSSLVLVCSEVLNPKCLCISAELPKERAEK